MMRAPDLPVVVRFAVPERTAPEAGLQPLVSRIQAGLPHAIALDASLTLGLVAPTGLARFWLALPPETTVSEAGDDLSALAVSLPPLRLILRRGNALAGVAPLALGPARFLAGDLDTPPAIRLRVTGWRLTAGSLVGAGDHGASVSLAWAPWGAAASTFAAPAARGSVLHRLVNAGEIRDPASEALTEAETTPGAGSGRFVGYGRVFRDG